MLFNSFAFAIFFPVAATVYFILPERFRKPLLLAASYYFYMYWNARYITVILAITLVDYFAGLGIEKSTGLKRRLILTASILTNFGMLTLFKYADIFGWLLPLGISFHTFQAVSYTIDVYRGNAKAERSLLNYALYVAFFPQMVAGPIERPARLLPQFHHPRQFDWQRIRSGLRLALWGLIKKSAVADLAATVVNTVYAHPRDFPGPLLLLATGLFSIQIYCDFSGYSDMAIGLARVLGYDLTVNFRQPYASKSIREFWQRWHISLSTWFRDYLYIPLGGNRLTPWRWRATVMLVFLTSGLWHGANWTFVVWGGIHGLYLIAGAATGKLRNQLLALSGLDRMPRLAGAAKIVATNALVIGAWIFFRASNLSDGFYILSHAVRFEGFDAENFFRIGLPRFEMAYLQIAIPVVLWVDNLRLRRPAWLLMTCGRPVLRLPLYAAGVYTVVFFGMFQHINFIYFQF